MEGGKPTAGPGNVVGSPLLKHSKAILNADADVVIIIP
jgi:hypothetical protein